VSLVLLAVVASASGLALLVAPRSSTRASTLAGVALAALAAVLAFALGHTDTTQLGGVGVASSGVVRFTAIVWSTGIVLLSLLDLAIGSRGAIVGPALTAFAVGVLALSLADPATGIAALAAGGLPAILVPGLRGLSGRADADRVETVGRGVAVVLAATLVAVAILAWGASPVGPLGSRSGGPSEDPAREIALGLALLALVATVVVRSGSIPAHVWVARFVESVPALAIPAALSWPIAVFVLVLLTWGQAALGSPTAAAPVEHGLVILAAVASVGFGGLAATLHDDVEHVLGYSIVQDAGIALLAFASLRPEATEAARDWLIAAAALKTGLAAWVATTRSTFGANRLADLAGWARHAPLLAAGLVVIAIGAIGLPGMAAFEARTTLVFGVLPRELGFLVMLAALLPVAYFGRLLEAGLRPMSPRVAAAPSTRPLWAGARPSGWSGRHVRLVARDLAMLARANRIPAAATIAFLLGAMGLVVALTGVTR
jgi:NADH:ubiquinone oxidoreductase subunit 2 (subunit N)